MRWRGERESENVEDRRRMSPPQMAIGGGVGTLVLVLVVWLLGGDPQAVLQEVQKQQPPGGAAPAGPVDPAEEEQLKMVKVVLGYTEDVWGRLFRDEIGREYVEPTLVPFSRSVQSNCGFASAAMGPFYCPGDQKVYLDLNFFNELDQRFKAPGEFARAYVVAHEVGHHVQNLLGYTRKLDAMRGRVGETEMNELSVRLELQADYLAGVWAHHTQKSKKFLEEGDVEAALNCARAIGDDTLQKKTQGHVVPDSFTHGTSAQRERWFREGIRTGDLSKLPFFFESNAL